MKLDSEVIKLFQQWQKDTGACPEFDIESVNFELHNFGDYVFTEKGATPKYSHVPTSCYVIKSGMARGGYNNFKLDTLYHLDLSGLRTPKYIKKGDLLLNTTGKGTAGRVTLFDLQGNYVSDSHITRIYPKDVNEDSSVFFLYFLSSYGFKNLEKMAEGSGGQVELNPERIKELKILVPASRQRFIIQNYIIKFIDYHKERFDKYRQFISALREKVESFDKAFLPAIFSAEKDVFIVKNFNDWAEQNGYSLSFEDVAFKIGKIVANSDSDKLVCTKRMGFTPDTSDNGDVPWFTVGDLSKVDGLYINIPITKDKTTMDLIKAKVDARGTGRSEKLIPIKKGDVLVSFKLTVGTTKIYNSDVPAYCNEAIDILTPLQGIYPSYLAYCCIIEYPKHGTKTNNGMTLNDESKAQIEIKIPHSHGKYTSEEVQKIIVKFIEAWQSWKMGMITRMDSLENSLNQAEETLIAKVFKGAE